MTIERSLDQLIEKNEPAWSAVSQWFRDATNPCEVLPVDRSRSELTLCALQVTTRSPLGAIALETGGILIDHGWVRILGGGGPGVEGDLGRWNGLVPGGLVIGYDVLGGFFVINGGALPGIVKNVLYLAPDSLVPGSAPTRPCVGRRIGHPSHRTQRCREET